jgi:hypothetical protein
MKPMRPVADRAVLQLIETMTFTGADFSIQHDGCRATHDIDEENAVERDRLSAP